MNRQTKKILDWILWGLWGVAIFLLIKAIFNL